MALQGRVERLRRMGNRPGADVDDAVQVEQGHVMQGGQRDRTDAGAAAAAGAGGRAGAGGGGGVAAGDHPSLDIPDGR